jgi:hypothetical protein
MFACDTFSARVLRVGWVARAAAHDDDVLMTTKHAAPPRPPPGRLRPGYAHAVPPLAPRRAAAKCRTAQVCVAVGRGPPAACAAWVARFFVGGVVQLAGARVHVPPLTRDARATQA